MLESFTDWLLADLLTQQWWVGLGGVAQVLAAALAIWTIRQVRSEAERARRESAAPAWSVQVDLEGHVITQPLATDVPHATMVKTWVYLDNQGPGFAADIEVDYTAHFGPSIANLAWGQQHSERKF